MVHLVREATQRWPKLAKKADEAECQHGLRRRGVNVITTTEAKNRGVTDVSQLEYAIKQDRVLVTKEDDFLSIHSTGREHKGIVFVRHNRSLAEVIRGLLLIFEVLDEKDMLNHVEFI